MTASLKDKRVLVTAGADGIGAAIAETFWRSGTRVHICARTEAKLRRRAEEMAGLTYTRADVSEAADVERMFAEIKEKLGGIDFLVNNAGIAGPTARVDNVELEDWERTLRTNLTSQFLCAKMAAPMMMEAGGGAIINIGSTAGLFAYPHRSPYAASKWAVIGFTKTLAAELGKFRIRANVICPGCVEGDRIDGVIEREAKELGVSPKTVRDGYLAQTALRTFINAQDIADMCLYLCSPAGEKISGQVITIDGFTENCHS